MKWPIIIKRISLLADNLVLSRLKVVSCSELDFLFIIFGLLILQARRNIRKSFLSSDCALLAGWLDQDLPSKLIVAS